MLTKGVRNLEKLPVADVEAAIALDTAQNTDSWRRTRMAAFYAMAAMGGLKKGASPEDLFKLPGDTKAKKGGGWGLLKKPKP